MREQHAPYLARRNFYVPPEVDVALFEREELEILSAYGHWLEALELKKISPYTEAQKHFVNVCNGAVPETKIEQAWSKFRRLHREARTRIESAARNVRATEYLTHVQRKAERLKENAERAISKAEGSEPWSDLNKALQEAIETATTAVLDRWWAGNGEQLTRQELEFISELESGAPIQLKLYLRRKVAETARPKKGEVCPVCGGDGGAKAECFKCDGTGWV